MNRFFLDFLEISKRFFKFHQVAFCHANVDGFYLRKFRRSFEQSKHLKLV